jgi:hypothetical protein
MSYGMLVGCVLLGASAVACGGARAQAPGIEEPSVAVSAGEGGAGNVESGEWATMIQQPRTQRQQRELYQRVSRELGLELGPAAAEPRASTGEAVGGGGRAGEGQRCAQVLAANEPAAVVSGTLEFASNGLLMMSVPGQGAVKLHADEDTCVVQARQELERPESLLEGTEVRASYVMKDGLPTVRVVRAEPVRPQR